MRTIYWKCFQEFQITAEGVTEIRPPTSMVANNISQKFSKSYEEDIK